MRRDSLEEVCLLLLAEIHQMPVITNSYPKTLATFEAIVAHLSSRREPVSTDETATPRRRLGKRDDRSLTQAGSLD